MNHPWNDLALDLLQRFGDKQQNAIPLLQAIQLEQGYIPIPLLQAIASKATELSANQLYGVATFYSQFTFTPKGKHTIKVCMGTACFVKGAEQIVDAFKTELSVDVGQTTADGLFTLQTVACLGCCSLAPAVMIDDRVHGQVTPSKVKKLIKAILPTPSASRHPSQEGIERPL